MSGDNTAECDGWRRRKCKPGVMVPAFKKRRAPSHLNSCARDPGYVKFNRLVSEFVSELDAENLEDRTRLLWRDMRSFLGRVGEDLLARALEKKTLCKLLLEEITALHDAVNSLSSSGSDVTPTRAVLHDIAKLLPPSAADATSLAAKRNMRALAEEYASEREEASARRKRDRERSGVYTVEWSDSE